MLQSSNNGKSPVVLVNNISVDQNLTPKDLFNLFGIYGNVMKVKIIAKKKDAALIQYQQAQQAHLAKTYLNNCPLFGKKIKISPSKYPNIVMIGEPAAGMIQEKLN